MLKNLANYLTEKEAQELTGYKTTCLWGLRKSRAVRWTSAKSGRKVPYLKVDLLKILGM